MDEYETQTKKGPLEYKSVLLFIVLWCQVLSIS